MIWRVIPELVAGSPTVSSSRSVGTPFTTPPATSVSSRDVRVRLDFVLQQTFGKRVAAQRDGATIVQIHFQMDAGEEAALVAAHLQPPVQTPPEPAPSPDSMSVLA